MKDATFIMSLDCEGKWGMADQLTQGLDLALTNERLNQAYTNICSLLQKYGVDATFAFVGAFTMAESEYLERREWFTDVPINGRPWIESFSKDADQKRYDGWLNPRALDIVRATGNHEIASHGFSHLPLSEPLTARNQFIDEMNKMGKLMKSKGIEIDTMVFPRNLIGYVTDLQDFGIKGFRSRLQGQSNRIINKAYSLLSEYNISQLSQIHSGHDEVHDEVIEIPPGYFLNWRSGLRKMVPITVSVARWKSIIRDAIFNDGVAHLWTHPHNFITGNRQYELLEQVLKLVAEAREDGKITIRTQRQYCAGFRISPTNGAP